MVITFPGLHRKKANRTQAFTLYFLAAKQINQLSPSPTALTSPL